jgi:CDP-diacylglycerol--serine O-phosphatidyltransferase
MVSRLPVFSGKRVGKRVAPEVVLPLFVVVVLCFALLIAYPWPVLTTATIVYLASLPFGFMSYRNHQRRDMSMPAQQPAVAHSPEAAAAAPPAHSEPPADPERPARLN